MQQVLAGTGKANERERDLPAQVMVCYAVAVALYVGSSTREVLRCLLEGLRWLRGVDAGKVAGKSGIAFGCPGASRGESAFPQARFVALAENGTHVLFGARLGRCADGETTLARGAVPELRPGMLCLADRYLFGYTLWRAAAATGADLLWRVKGNLRLPRATVLADGSYPSVAYPSEKDRRHATNGVQVRVVEYRLQGVAGTEPLHRLVTTILDPAQAPAADLAALHHERWGIEGALAELKTQLRGAQAVLRSKAADRARSLCDFAGCARSSGACCWRTSPCAVSCTRRKRGRTRTRIRSQRLARAGCRSCMPCAGCAASCRCLRLFPPRGSCLPSFRFNDGEGQGSRAGSSWIA